MTGGGGSAPKNPPFKPDAQFPAYTPIPTWDLLKNSIHLDQEAYQRSDADFAARHRPVVQAENLFQNSVLNDQKGDTTLAPQIQNEMVRAGLNSAGNAFGDTPGTLAPNSAAEADVARNLGLGVMQFQDRNRANREQSLNMAENIFPRRSFGFGGDVATELGLANWAGQQNHDLSKFNNDMQVQELNWRNQAQNNANQIQQQNASAAAGASSTGQIVGTVAQVIGLVAAAYVAMILIWV